MRKKIIHLLPSLISILLLIGSSWAIHNELQHYRASDIWKSLISIPAEPLLMAIGLTALNEGVFTGYDALAVQYVRQPLPYCKTAIVAITSISVSNMVGFALLSGSAIRYRFYAPWGLSTLKIAQVIAFCNLSFWLGLFVVGGLIFVSQPIAIPTVLHVPFQTTQPLGVMFLSIIVAYVLWNGLSHRSLTLGKWVIPHLPLKLCLAQLVVGSLDWTIAAAVLYTLLPQFTSLSYSSFFAVYLLAQFAGVVSNVPGGLGVFETVILLLLSSSIPTTTLFGAMLAYRAVYYLLPLLLAVLLLGLHEVYGHQS